MKELPLQVIIKELANTPWSKLPEDCLRNIHTQLTQADTECKLKVLIIPGYVKTNVSDVFSDIKITYQLEKALGDGYRLILDEVFIGDNVITNLLSEKAKADIVYEATVILERTTLYVVNIGDSYA